MAGEPKKLSPFAEQCEHLITSHLHAGCFVVSTPGRSLNNHMFSSLTREDRLARSLSEDQREELIEKQSPQETLQHGRVIQEFVDLPALPGQSTPLQTHLFDNSNQYTPALILKAIKRWPEQKASKKTSAGTNAVTGKSQPRKKGR